MSYEAEEGARQGPPTRPTLDNGLLGLPMEDLAGLSVEKLTHNETAITMLLHYYKQLVDENQSLKNDVNSIKTYVGGYQSKVMHSRIGAWLQFLAVIFVGFGINLLSGEDSGAPGWFLLVAGITAQGFGMVFSLRSEAN